MPGRLLSRFLLSSFLCSSLLGGVAAAQEGGSTAPRGFRGIIKIEGQHDPGQRIEVVLLRSDRSTRDRTFSDQNGNFEFLGLPPGSYYVRINHPGFETLEDSFDIYPRVGGVQTRYYSLLPQRTSAPNAPGAAVSVQSLKVPKEARHWYEEGEKERTRGNHDRAASYYRRALDIHPTFAEALHGQGLVYVEKNELAVAREWFEKAIAVDPQFPDAYIALGALLNRDTPAAAIPPLTKGVELAPQSWHGCYQLCRAYFALQQWEPAERMCLRAKESAPQARVEILITLGNLYLNLKRYPESLREFEAFLKLDPNSSVAPQARALTEKLRAAGVKPAP